MRQINYLAIRFAIGLSLITFLVQAQDKTEKETVSMNLAYYQLNDDLPVIKLSAKTKKGKKFEPVEAIEANLFFGSESSEGFLGKVKTNHFGVASMTLPARFKAQWDSLNIFTFIGTVTQNDRFKDQSAELEITRARIELTLQDVDSVRTIHAKVLAFQDKGWAPHPETEIKLVVRRLLSDLKATEEDTFTTDENGEVSAEFSLSVPGDVLGDIMIGAKIDDHDTYGNLVSAKAAKWGLPQIPDNSFAKRTLWATRDKTPLWLLIFPNLIIVSVWGIIFYLFFLITRIIKLGKTNNTVQ